MKGIQFKHSEVFYFSRHLAFREVSAIKTMVVIIRMNHRTMIVSADNGSNPRYALIKPATFEKRLAHAIFQIPQVDSLESFFGNLFRF